MKKFTELPYERPDLDALLAELAAINERFKSAANAAEAREAYLEYENVSKHVWSLASISYNRHSIDTRDAFYAAEKEFWNNASPQLQEPGAELTDALLSSPFRAELEAEFGNLMFLNSEIELRTFKPEIIGDLQEENKLVSEYDKLIASAQIEFCGEKRTLAQMTPFKVSSDDVTRRAAWRADGEWYENNSAALDELYAKLLEKRIEIAKKLGHDSYVPLGYDRMGRNCYDKNDLAKFRAAVLKYIVPIATQIKKAQAERLGVAYPMSLTDDSLEFRTGNATPSGTADDILAHARRMYEEMSPETAEFVKYLYDFEMFDVLSKPGKAAGGHCSTIPEYGPFIFSNFNGTKGDVEVMTHEAGHAFAAYMSLDIVPMANQNYTPESAEIHSMAMEFFAWNWAEGFFGGDTAKFLFSHLADALTFIPYGTMVDHFQHIMYEKPTLTPAERHDEWMKLEKLYRPWLALEGELPFYGEGKGWQRQLHIYKYPFYYIDYCLAQTIALQFWAVMQNDRADAWRRYVALVKKAGTETFRGLVATAELSTPFGDEALSQIASAAEKFLNEFDMEVIK